VEGLVRIALCDQAIGEEINIATQKETSIKSLVEEISLLTGCKIKPETDPTRLRPTRSEVDRLLGSNEKIKRLTGWQPRFSLHQGLIETLRWYDCKDRREQFKSGAYVR
jgi:nucleoside-diphosphate-sugar epimerase